MARRSSVSAFFLAASFAFASSAALALALAFAAAAAAVAAARFLTTALLVSVAVLTLSFTAARRLEASLCAWPAARAATSAARCRSAAAFASADAARSRSIAASHIALAASQALSAFIDRSEQTSSLCFNVFCSSCTASSSSSKCESSLLNLKIFLSSSVAPSGDAECDPDREAERLVPESLLLTRLLTRSAPLREEAAGDKDAGRRPPPESDEGGRPVLRSFAPPAVSRPRARA